MATGNCRLARRPWAARARCWSCGPPSRWSSGCRRARRRGARARRRARWATTTRRRSCTAAGGGFQEHANRQSESIGRKEPSSDISSDSAELTSGPGKWVTVSIEKRTALNFIHVVMTRISTLSEGRPIGSDGMDFRNTVRDVTQEWQRLGSVEEENLRSDGLISVRRIYGETRVIKQTYVESKDDWTVSGRSWHWHPVHADVEYEFEPID